jgi:putative endonuclease
MPGDWQVAAFYWYPTSTYIEKSSFASATLDRTSSCFCARIGIVKTKSAIAEPDASAWVLYLLECENGTYYAGITTDLDRRFAEHVFGIGARYTRANPPLRVVAAMEFPDRASASRAEATLKNLPRNDKPGYFKLTA